MVRYFFYNKILLLYIIFTWRVYKDIRLKLDYFQMFSKDTKSFENNGNIIPFITNIGY